MIFSRPRKLVDGDDLKINILQGQDKNSNLPEKFPKEWKKAIYKRVLLAYNVDGTAELAPIIKEKFGHRRQIVYDWQSGKSKPTEKLLEKISKDTGRSVRWFLTGEEEAAEVRESEEDLALKQYRMALEIASEVPPEERRYADQLVSIAREILEEQRNKRRKA